MTAAERSCRVLIVGGDASAGEILRTILEGVGHEVTFSGEGIDALRRMGRRLPDLVITELYMDGMEGLEFMRRVREAWPKQRIIVMNSGNRPGELNVLRIARLLGAAGYLDEPLRERKVLDSVRAILAS